MWKLNMTSVVSRAPVLPDLADAGVQVWRDLEGRVCAYGHTLGGRHWMHLPGLASFSFDGTSEEVRAVAHPPARPELIRDAYFRSVLPMALQVSDREVLHASAIQAPRGVVALCGVSEAGKSTIAFGLSRRGFPAWADDAVAFETAGGGVTAIPLPFGFRLREPSRSFFGRSGTPASTPSQDERERRLAAPPAPLVALVVLKRAPEDADGVEVELLRPARAFPLVLAHAYCFNLADRERKQRMVRHYLAVVDRVPVFELLFPVGLEWLPAVLDRVEQLARTT